MVRPFLTELQMWRPGKNAIKMVKERFRWFGHVERIKVERSVRRIHDVILNGRRNRGHLRKTWNDQVNQILKSSLDRYL